MTLMDSRRLSAAGLMLLIGFAPPIDAVAQSESTGLEIGGLPALNFDADEGFGYGALVELYQYGQSGLRPYVWSLRPTVFLTSGGRRDFTVFLDAPHVLSAGWRLDAYLGSEKQIATPYYGIGNATPYDETRDDAEGPDPFYYRFGRTRRSAKFNLQRDVGETPLRWLVGAGLVRTSVLPVPDNEGSTLFETEIAARESLVTQVEAAARPDALVRSAVDEIVDSGDNASVADLARRLEISQRQFQRRFRKAVGITPKQFSRIRRFRACVVNMITEEPEAWGRVAVRSGYADQAHLIREFVRLSGRPPTALDAYIRGIDHGDVDP